MSKETNKLIGSLKLDRQTFGKQIKKNVQLFSRRKKSVGINLSKPEFTRKGKREKQIVHYTKVLEITATYAVVYNYTASLPTRS